MNEQMRTFWVTILRTEAITFAVDAEDEQQAEKTCLAEGTEVYSETRATVVESVEPQ